MSTQEVSSRYRSTEQLYRLLDLSCIALSTYVSIFVLSINSSPYYFILASTCIIVFFILSEMVGTYQHEISRMFKTSVKSILLTWTVTFLFLLVIGYFSGNLKHFPRTMITIWFIATPIYLVIWRYAIKLAKSKYYQDASTLKNFAILGANTVGSHVADTILDDFSIGYRFLGFYDDRKKDDKRIVHSLGEHTYLGDFDQAVEDARRGKLDVIFIVLPMVAEYRIAKILDLLGDSATEVHIIPNFFVYNLLHARWHNIGSYLALSIYDTPFYGVGSMVKRIEDIILGSIILSLISIPMLIIAIIIKVTMPGGPVIFKQKRYGIGGQEVTVWKFRSMSVCEDGDSVKQATKDDQRITPFGAFIRRTSLDEFPQFINVLQGTMSIVGPRPHAVAHNEFYRKEIDGYMLRHMVKPGITGLAQISGCRGETKEVGQMRERIKYDLRYIRNWSLYLDIKIIFLTIFKGFVNKQAY